MQTESSPARSRRLDELAEALPQRASTISRLFLKHASIEVSRTETGVLRLLSERPRRITELAACEGVTQPAITMLVNRFVERGWVARETDPSDARAVLVKLTPEGKRTFETLRSEYRALLHEEMATLPDRDVAALARAVDILDSLIERLRERHS